MLVSQILNSKAAQGVETVPPETTIAQAAEILSKRRFGALIVSVDGDVATGILSERDIVRELAKDGSGCLTRPVSQYMTCELHTSTSQASVQEVLTRMTEGRFRHMPVVEDGKMIGLVTLGDLVKAQLSELAMEKQALEGMIMGH